MFQFLRSGILLSLLLVLFNYSGYAQEGKNRLNKDLEFHGSYIMYKGKNISLGPRSFYIDGQLTADQASKYQYVFNSVNEAAKHLINGTEESPMILFMAPYVYWIDNPDDTAIRVPAPGATTPFGLEIKCEWLKFY